MREKSLNVAVLNTPQANSPAANTLREVVLKDPSYRKRWHSGQCRKVHVQGQGPLPAPGTMVNVPLREDAVRKLRRITHLVKVGIARQFLVYLPNTTSLALPRKERFHQRFEHSSREVLKELSTLIDLRVEVDSEKHVGVGPVTDEEVAIVRPLRALNMMFIDVPVNFSTSFGQKLTSLGLRYTEMAPLQMEISKPTPLPLGEQEPIAELMKQVGQDEQGAGFTIGIVDTGVDPLHVELSDRQIAFAEFDDSGRLTNSGPRPEYSQHGTHVAMLAAGRTKGAAPAASLAVAAAVAGNYRTTVPRIITAIDWLIYSANSDILNLSFATLGGAYAADYKAAIIQAVAESIVVVAATGNYGPGSVGCPSAYEEVIAVGATMSDGSFWDRSGHGYVRQEGRVYKPDVITQGLIGDIVRTSFAAPRIAGLIAVHRLANNPDFRRLLRALGSPIKVGRHPHAGVTYRL